jgi:predicted methyltransferase
MADGKVLDVSDAPVFTTEITERSEIECQCCVGLKLELNKIAMELESASEVIEILKEEPSVADALSSANTLCGP